jgi:hypothetical protein
VNLPVPNSLQQFVNYQRVNFPSGRKPVVVAVSLDS